MTLDIWSAKSRNIERGAAVELERWRHMLILLPH